MDFPHRLGIPILLKMISTQRLLIAFGSLLNYLTILTVFAQNDFTNVATRNPADFGFSHDHVLSEGDRCYHYIRRSNGMCLNPNRCPEVIKDFQNGIQPQICSYSGIRPIICCPLSAQVASSSPSFAPAPSAPTFTSATNPSFASPSNSFTSSQPTIATIPSTVSTSIPQSSAVYAIGRISEQRCEQYARLSVERNIVGSFSLGERINNTIEKSKCAFSGGGGFIVGGTITKPGEFPHMAAIGWTDDNGVVSWNCGGSLISYRFVLTAAHCAMWRGRPPRVVRLGAQNLKKNGGADPRDYPIEQVLRHPSYKASLKYNDIALLKLNQRVYMNDFVRPACLWQSFYLNYTSAIATGWGLIRDRGQPSDELLKVSLNIITNERCNSLYQPFNALRNGIIDTQVCAGDDYEEKDTCNGDSGKLRQ